jgi:hypothetical protein
MVIDPPPDALKPDFQCVRTPWNRGFMTLQLARHPAGITTTTTTFSCASYGPLGRAN